MEFNDWLNKKKLMWSPEEWAAIQTGHAEQIAEARRVWEDDEAGRPRKAMIILSSASAKNDSNTLSKSLDAIGDDVFTEGYSADGKDPATHFLCSWNMSFSEYALFEAEREKLEQHKKDVIQLYDGQKTTVAEVLLSSGLKRIEVELTKKTKEI